MENKQITLNLYWMPSHTDTDPKKAAKAPDWMRPWHVQGNKETDNLAEAAGRLHELPPYVTDPITLKLTNLKLIQKRLVEITKLLPKREHHKPNTTDIQKPTKREILLEKIASSNHQCLIHNNRVTCTICANSIPRDAENIADFLESPCLPREYSISYMIGNNHTHSSHNIEIYGGVYIYIYICTTCGNTAHNKVLQLRKPCSRPKAHGKVNLRA